MKDYDTFGPDWINAQGFGAVGDGVVDCTDAIQAALNEGGPVYLPVGTYKISDTLQFTASGQSIRGAGAQLTSLSMPVMQADGIYASGLYQLGVHDLSLVGPFLDSGTGDGIHFAGTDEDPVANCWLSNVTIAGFGGNGLFIDVPITSALVNVETRGNGNYGFYLENGTSTNLIGCYSNADGVRGYYLDAMSYSALHGCACDGTGTWAYVINGCKAIALTGCGAESQVADGAYQVIGGSGISLTACESYQQPGIGFYVNSDAANVTLDTVTETDPAAGATASIEVNSGCTAVVTNPTVTTAATYTAGTSYVITSAGGTVH